MLTICENEMDKDPLRYLWCRLQFHKWHDLTNKSPSVLGCVFTAEELLPQEPSARALQPPGKWQVTPLGGTAPLPQDTKTSSGRSQGLSWHTGRWCDPVTVRLTLALSLSTKERAGNLTASEVLKTASSRKSWTDPELIVASQAVQQLQSDST